MKERKTWEIVRSILLTIILLIPAMVYLFPLLWVVSTSLKPVNQIFVLPPRLIPTRLMFSNYVEAWKSGPFADYFMNSLLTSVIPTLGTMLSASLVAFSFSRLRWKGRDFMFTFCVATMMVPANATLIPRFLLFRSIGWIDTLLPLIVPYLFSLPFYVFLLRQFYLTLPTALEDAGRIDGCSSFGIWARVLLPLTAPGLIVVGLFSFLNRWNEFLEPLVFINTESKKTLMLGVQAFLTVETNGEITIHLMMASAIITMFLPLVLFFVLQRYFIEGVKMSGMKE